MAKHARVLWVAAGLGVVTAILPAADTPSLARLTLPVSWPALFILGADETQETYGRWGECVLFWLCSLPCIAAYAWLLCTCWEDRPAPRAEKGA